MTWEACTKTITHKRIKLADPGSKRSAIFLNDDQLEHSRTRADGCWITEGQAADWILERTDLAIQAIVELKGKDVAHACTQILATAQSLKEAGQLGKKIAGLIVCTQYPRNDTKIQRARLEFSKQYKGPIHAVTTSHEFVLAKVVDFSGPH